MLDIKYMTDSEILEELAIFVKGLNIDRFKESAKKAESPIELDVKAFTKANRILAEN